MSIWDKLYVRLGEMSNPYFASHRRKQLCDESFTIISNNCWGGHCYRYFSLPYNSPTVGLYFYPDDFIKFVQRLNHYMSMELKFIQPSMSKYYPLLVEKGETAVPIGLLDDVEIVFLHYKTEQEALEKWNRRKARMNWDHLCFKFSEMNGCRNEHLQAFDALPYPDKFVFTVRRRPDIKCSVYYRGYSRKHQIINDTTYFTRGLGLMEFLNGKLWAETNSI